MTGRIALLYVIAVLSCFVVSTTWAFSVSPGLSTSLPPNTVFSPLWRSKVAIPLKRYMADASPPEPNGRDNSEESESSSISPMDDGEGEEKPVPSEDYTTEGGMWKTVILAGPLFLKFVVVLL